MGAHVPVLAVTQDGSHKQVLLVDDETWDELRTALCRSCAFTCFVCYPCTLWYCRKIHSAEVVGIPKGAVELVGPELEHVHKILSGNWKVQPLQSSVGSAQHQYTEAFFNTRNSTIILSGGTHTEVHKVMGDNGRPVDMHVAVPNPTVEQRAIFFRGPDGTIYLDNIGSHIVDDEPGQITILSGMNVMIMWQREWKRSEMPDPDPYGTPQITPATPLSSTMSRA